MSEVANTSTTIEAEKSGLNHQLIAFKAWRDSLASSLSSYRDWLTDTHTSDAMQDLRLFDMAETLNNDRLLLAFIAEFSRGKTEMINALFFSDYGERLLPSNPGRTTMCPTEIFWDAREEPCIRLLPIETRKQDHSLSYHKSNPAIWTTIRLNMQSIADMKQAFQSIAQQKPVTQDEARALGLWIDDDISMQLSINEKGLVEIPVWRHAMINFPHPLLKSGLVILDTPGLNTIGSEPELTLNVIPNAHAVIFLLATDTGVTKSDMQIWSEYISTRASRKIAVLNKIDILWDEMKTQDEIDAMVLGQVQSTARLLGLPASHVLALSAQKALLAKVKKDPELLSRSGMLQLEKLLAEQVIGAKHEIIRATLIKEASDLMKNSRKLIQPRLLAAKARLAELESLKNQNQSVVQSLLSQITEDKKRYEASMKSFKEQSQSISKSGLQMLEQLDIPHLNALTEQSRRSIDNSWTTVGLNRSIKQLVQDSIALAEQVNIMAEGIQNLSTALYQQFHTTHGFEPLTPSPLDISDFVSNMQYIANVTEKFCADPLNVMTEKHFLIKKFFKSLDLQVELVFEDTRKKIRYWLQDILSPLLIQINEHKSALDDRSDSLMQLHKSGEAGQQAIANAKQALMLVQSQCTALDKMLLTLVKDHTKQAPAPVKATAPLLDIVLG